ncbi:MAG: helix-turn-helix domain-containing protein [Methylovirgula sp.]|uniref:TetR/AcrR family transcriptional regulator n=1 Tax=Methylovirgula sp. TaxID=1978224 RepID=UPI00307660C6
MVHTTGTSLQERARRLDSAVRDRLFGIATEAFVQHGYDGASLNAILAAAKMGKSSFFYYFLDKEDLFASVIEAAAARVGAAAGLHTLPAKPARFWPETLAILEHWGAAAEREPGFVGLLRALQPLRRTANPRLVHVFDDVHRIHRSLLQRGIELGVVRNDLGIDTLMALIDAVDLVLDDAFHRDPAPREDALAAHRQRVIDTIQRIVRP